MLSKIRAVDLFCGCGGMSLGFQDAGFQIECAYDNWEPAVQIYKDNFSHPIYQILTKIINIVDSESPDGVIIAGDVYDKSVPSAEAVELFDDFLVRLAKRNLQVFVISGNHDSPERIAFGSRFCYHWFGK